MSFANHAELAQQLANVRGTRQLAALQPFDAIPSLADAYEIQHLATDAYDSPRIGYKVGATNEAVQAMFGCNEPFYGPVFERECYPAGQKINLLNGILGGEAEFAFHCSSDFPNEELTIESLPQLIASCHIATEIVGRRTLGDGLPPLNTAVADYGANVAFIPGPAIDNWSKRDLASIEVIAKTNGVEPSRGTGAAVLGHLLNSLLWLHNTLRCSGRTLKAQEWVSTGTCLGVIPAVAESQVDIEFIDCGTMSYRFS